MRKKVSIFAVLMLSLVTISLALTGCGKTEEKQDTGKSKNGISIFNSKMEVQQQMEAMAKKYEKETGVHVEVYYTSDTITAHLATKYASNSPYTLTMVDPKDIYSLAEEHAVDLSDEKWVKDTNYALNMGDKTYGFPICVEARGIIYNGDAIKKVTGKDFNPEDYQTLDRFKALIKELKAGGMKNPTGVMKEDWSLAAHYLAQIYEEQPNPDEFVYDLSKGKEDMGKNKKFNQLMDVFDVLKNNSYSKAGAISAEREVTEQKLAEGEIAFLFGGNWDWSVISAYDYTKNMGMMPIPQNTKDGTNQKLVGGGSKYIFIDSSKNTTDKQRQEAKDFLNWLVYNQEGQNFLVNDCALVPAFKNNTLPVKDPLGTSVKKYSDANMLVPNYNYLPDDHITLMGASFQKYLAGMSDRKGFAKEVNTYWKTKTLTKHDQ